MRCAMLRVFPALTPVRVSCCVFVRDVRTHTYSTRIVRESSSVRAGACNGPGGSCEVSRVTCELLVQPTAVHALSTKKWVEYTPRPETNTHTDTHTHTETLGTKRVPAKHNTKMSK